MLTSKLEKGKAHTWSLITMNKPIELNESIFFSDKPCTSMFRRFFRQTHGAMDDEATAFH